MQESPDYKFKLELQAFIDSQKQPLLDEIEKLQTEQASLKRNISQLEQTVDSWRVTADEATKKLTATEDTLNRERKERDVRSANIHIWDMYASAALAAIPHLGKNANWNIDGVAEQASMLADKMMTYR